MSDVTQVVRMHDNNVRIPYNYSVHFILLLDLTFDLDVDKIATTRDEGATLTCRASIEFPPFSMLSLIKNGQMVATSINSSLQINAGVLTQTNLDSIFAS